jgi:hypothetical protein
MPKQRTTDEERLRKRDYRSRKRLVDDAGIQADPAPTLPGFSTERRRRIGSRMQAVEKEIQALDPHDRHPGLCAIAWAMAELLDNPLANTSHVAAAKQLAETLKELRAVAPVANAAGSNQPVNELAVLGSAEEAYGGE